MARLARPVLALVMAATVGLGTSGCGPVDAGSAVADEYRAWMGGTANVERVELAARNTLPWSGDAIANVILTPGVSLVEAKAVIRHATAFRSDNPVSVTITYQAPGFTASFYADRYGADARNLEMMELALEVDRETNATSLRATDEIGAKPLLSVTEDGDVLKVFDRLTELSGTHDHLAFGDYSATNVGETYSITSSSPQGAPAARAAYEAVKARYPVTEAHLGDAALSLRVESKETPDVAALVRQVAPLVVPTVQFGNVTKAVGEPEGTIDGDYTAADPLIAIANATGAVTSVDAYPKSIDLHCADVAAIFTANRALDGIPSNGVTVSYTTNDARFSVTGSQNVTDYRSLLTLLSDEPLSTSLKSAEITDLGIDIKTLDYDTARASMLGTALAQNVPNGTAVYLSFPATLSFDFSGSVRLTRADIEDPPGHPDKKTNDLIDSFVEGWNSPTSATGLPTP